MEFEVVSQHEAEKTHQRLREFRRNREVLEREWPRLFAEHPGEWVAVYGNGELVVSETTEHLDAVVPEDKWNTAILRYIRPTEDALIL